MACNCKHNKQEIENGKRIIEELRQLFIKRMTVDSDHNDRRRGDFNQAIFDWWYDEPNKVPENTFPCWTPMRMKCFCAIVAMIMAIVSVLVSTIMPIGSMAEVSLNILAWIFGGLGAMVIFSLTID